MRPLFAIAPLALAFVLLGPTTADVSSSVASPSLIAKVWNMVFEHDAVPAAKPTLGVAETAALNR